LTHTSTLFPYTTLFRSAKPDTNFYYRMAAWPAAFEEGMIEANRRHFPEQEFSVYAQGHSTGGPFICMLSQRISNLAGVCATEHSDRKSTRLNSSHDQIS